MKRLVIICEGETEQEFCKKVLAKHLCSLEIYVYTPLIKKSLGGIVPWKYIKKQVLMHLDESSQTYVSMLIDYYGLYDRHKFPKWADSKNITDKLNRMSFLEDAMRDDISERVRYRFIPYIQLHEFEGLLFCDIDVFKTNIPASDITDFKELEHIISNCGNPELINNGCTTAPSKRLLRLINGYNKVVYGPILAEAITLDGIRKKAVRFNQWVGKLESL